MSYDPIHRTINGVDAKEVRMNGKIRTFDTGATRDTDQGKPDFDGFLSPLVLEEFGKYMHKHRVQSDGSLRDSDNWQRGIPLPQYMKSMFRHFLDAWRLHRGYEVKDTKTGLRLTLREALTALLFNVMGYLHELLKEELMKYGPELGEGSRTVLYDAADAAFDAAYDRDDIDLDDCGTTDGVTPLPPMSEDTHRTTPGIDENGNSVYEPKIDRLKEDTDEDFTAIGQFDKATNANDRYAGFWNNTFQSPGIWRLKGGVVMYHLDGVAKPSHMYSNVHRFHEDIASGYLVPNTWTPLTPLGTNGERE